MSRAIWSSSAVVKVGEVLVVLVIGALGSISVHFPDGLCLWLVSVHLLDKVRLLAFGAVNDKVFTSGLAGILLVGSEGDEFVVRVRHGVSFSSRALVR